MNTLIVVVKTWVSSVWGGFFWYYTPCCLEAESTLLLLGGSDGEKATIQNRKVVFVVIVVMTHCSVLHLCGKQAQLVGLSFVVLVLRVCIVLYSALSPCPFQSTII